MSTLNLKIDTDRLTVDDLILIEDAGERAPKVRELRDLVARFVVDAAGAFLSDAEARAVVGQLSVRQLKEALGQLNASIGQMQESTVPKASGNAS